MPIDQRLHLVLHPSRQHRILENLHVPRRHRSRAGLAQRSCGRAIEAVGSQAEQHSGLSSSKIVANRLARGDRISPNAEELIAQGECDAGMTAESLQSAMSRRRATSGSCPEGQRARHCVGTRLKLRESLGMGWITSTCRRTGEITALAQDQLDAQLVPEPTQLGSQGGDQPMGLYQREVTKQYGKVSSEGRAVATCVGLGVPALGLSVCRGTPAAQIGLIHHVVMEQGKLVQQLKGRCGPDHLRMANLVNLTAGGDISPMAHGRPDPLASLLQKIIQPRW